ncbi:Nudix family hydrolase [Lysobacter sp. A03]|uniref:Nudix family hydrolase n=1 Tax=Lysobacter sp. A03 TaxID=1199154 RepID=UPI0005B73400|nr:Nudix family hydrolase [Lysobacter sp. A03]KIQ97428.1 Mutator mutT protein (7,8-dihydro-8-oxoguanine-triphosphatase) [Lysobacter sp. A03]
MTETPPTRFVRVVAGVICDARGRILLAQRTGASDLGGLWEFPGGKIDPGESPEHALVRELDEELGIQAEVGEAVITVPQLYPDKRLTLDVRHVTRWQGNPRGREGQALLWVPPRKLARYRMPPADRPVVAALQQPDRYLVTPDVGQLTAGMSGAELEAGEQAWLDALERTLATGISRVQLRAPSADPRRWARLAASAVELCQRVSAEVLVNGDLELAARLGAGVHLRSDQLSAHRDRPVDPGLALAASCHTVDDLRAAERLGCTFVVLGNVLPTATHPGRNGIGWEAFAAMREHVSMPIYAIGGLGIQHMDQARLHGAQGIAAIRGLWAD